MTPDSASALRESINIHPTPRPRCATLPRPSVVDVVEEHRTASGILQPVSTPKTTPTSGRATLNATVIQSGRPRFRVSPGVARTSRQESITTKAAPNRCLQGGNDAERHHQLIRGSRVSPGG
jgi:hypothetical protein